MAIAGMAGRARAAAPSIIRVGTMAGGAGLGGAAGGGYTGAACGACGGEGARCPTPRGGGCAGALVPDRSGFCGPSFGDFEKRLIPVCRRYQFRARARSKAPGRLSIAYTLSPSAASAPPLRRGLCCNPFGAPLRLTRLARRAPGGSADAPPEHSSHLRRKAAFIRARRVACSSSRGRDRARARARRSGKGRRRRATRCTSWPSPVHGSVRAIAHAHAHDHDGHAHDHNGRSTRTAPRFGASALL